VAGSAVFEAPDPAAVIKEMRSAAGQPLREELKSSA
jgi:hypothetical protein